MGYGQTAYSFNEDESGQVCVVIEEGGVESTQGVDLSVTFSDGTATGELVHLLVCQGRLYIIIETNYRGRNELLYFHLQWLTQTMIQLSWTPSQSLLTKTHLQKERASTFQ